MYHFTAAHTTNAFEKVVLANKQTVASHITQCLRPFQLDAIRFLDKNLSKGDFCVLNDESGLGKTAVVSVLLDIHARSKKCLIVVKNYDEHINNWEFHLNVLTQLQVTVIRSSKDTTTSPHSVYIAKWTTIRTIADLSKFKFDLVILDNRGDTLGNNFCTSMLLKQFEKKVNIVVSSVDITSDIKLLHNILRLGGRLEPRYENFKLFQNKFELPAATDATTKQQLDLELYFRKRAMLADLVNDFRLRRYRHQYDDMLPLVSKDTYSLNLTKWREEIDAKHKPIIEQVVVLSSDSGSTIGTEQVMAQVAAIAKKVPCVQVTNDAKPPEDLQTHFEPIDATEDAVVMSPLVFVSDSETDEETNTPAELKLPENPAIVSLSSSEECNELVALPPLSDANSAKATSTDSTTNVAVPIQSTSKEQTQSNAHNGTHETGKHEKTTEAKSPRGIKEASKDIIVIEEARKTRASKRKLLEPKHLPPPKKTRMAKGVVKHQTKAPIVPAEKAAAKEKHESAAQTPITASKRKKSTSKTKKNARILEMSSHTRETRFMQRRTRALDSKTNSKYIKRELALVIDKKSAGSKPKKKVQTSKVEQTKNKQTEMKKDESKKDNKKAKTKDKTKKSQQTQGKSVEKQCASQASIVSCSDYEDIQCGQKIDCNTEYTVNAHATEKDKKTQYAEFISPPARSTQLSMLLTSFNEPDLMIVSPPPQRTHKSDIIILSSSLDDSSVSSLQSECSRRTRALKLKKAAANQSINAQHKHNLASFAEVINKQQRCKSPDLFSNYSDAINCTQSMLNDDKPNETVRPFDGFKIFGSEVKQYQQQYASQRVSSVANKNKHERSCLDILEKMFEPRAAGAGDKLTTHNTQNMAKKTPPAICAATRVKVKRTIMPQHPIAAIERTQAEQASKLAEREKLKRSTRVAEKPNAQKARSKTLPATAPTTNAAEIASACEDEEIFEITNNATFGSMLRVNNNGDVTPVAQTQLPAKQTQPNKITKYFAGLVPVTQTQAKSQRQQAGTPILATPPDEDQLDKTIKRTQTQLHGSGNVRKSPKSPKNQMQTTKLTRWLMKNNGDSNDTSTAAATAKYPTPATTPSNANNERAQKLTRRSATNRRRLEMH